MTPEVLTQCPCGLHPDEHCGRCGQCPGWHEIDCERLGRNQTSILRELGLD